MKKNKTVAYALAATLLVGGTFLGTKALFTDKVDTVGELSISTGDVDIEATTAQDWKLARNGEDDSKGTTGPAQFDNLKFGDVLTKKVTITNEGTLKVILTLDENKDKTSKLPDGIEFNATFKDGDNDLSGKVFEPGQTATVELKLEVTKGSEHSKTEKLINSDAQEEQIIDLEDGFIINAQQITKDTAVN